MKRRLAAIILALKRSGKFVQRGGRSFNRGSKARSNFNPDMRNYLRSVGHKPSEYQTFYHGTNSKFIPSIRKKGLLPISLNKANPPLLYMATRDIARPYVGMAKHGESSSLVKVRVRKNSVDRIPYIPGQRLGQFTNVRTTPNPIRPQYIRSIQQGPTVVDTYRADMKQSRQLRAQLKKETHALKYKRKKS